MIVLLTNNQVGYVPTANVGEVVTIRLLDDDGIPSDELVEGQVGEVLDSE